MSLRDHLDLRIQASLEAVGSLRGQIERVETLCSVILATLDAGGTIYSAGNGGSAAQAVHLAEELIGRYRGDRPPQRAVCLNADAAALTCIANDYGYEAVFSRQCQALLAPGDALVALSTSGNSANIIEALRVGRERGSTTLGLLGNAGGGAAALCDHAIIVPGTDSAHIQEAHQVAIHLICEAVELARV